MATSLIPNEAPHRYEIKSIDIKSKQGLAAAVIDKKSSIKESERTGLTPKNLISFPVAGIPVTAPTPNARRSMVYEL